MALLVKATLFTATAGVGSVGAYAITTGNFGEETSKEVCGRSPLSRNKYCINTKS